MRWDNLFQDLEAQLETVLGDEVEDALRDSERARRGAQTLAEVMIEELSSGNYREPIQLCTAGGNLWITVDNFGSDWISGEVSAPVHFAGYCIVNVARVSRVVLASSSLTNPTEMSSVDHRIPPGAARRLGRVTLRIVLRDLVRRRKSGWVVTADAQFHGTLDRVGKDFVELAQHSPRSPRRQESIENQAWIQLSEVCVFRLDD